jgi:hypothetical protein
MSGIQSHIDRVDACKLALKEAKEDLREALSQTKMYKSVVEATKDFAEGIDKAIEMQAEKVALAFYSKK